MKIISGQVTLLSLIVLWCVSVTNGALVNSIDPAGGSDVDTELGNISLAAFNALNPLVQDWEGPDAPLTSSNEAFSIGSVGVTGTYGSTQVDTQFSGNRFSFTDPDGGTPGDQTAGNLIGNWNTSESGNVGNGDLDLAEFNFNKPILAVGLAWLGRDFRPLDPTLTAIVTLQDNTTVTLGPLVHDNTGDGLPVGKDVFVGYMATANNGIVQLRVSNDVRQFNGWDDLGIVTFASIPEPATVALLSLGGLSMLMCRRRAVK